MRQVFNADTLISSSTQRGSDIEAADGVKPLPPYTNLTPVSSEKSSVTGRVSDTSLPSFFSVSSNTTANATTATAHTSKLTRRTIRTGRTITSTHTTQHGEAPRLEHLGRETLGASAKRIPKSCPIHCLIQNMRRCVRTATPNATHAPLTTHPTTRDTHNFPNTKQPRAPRLWHTAHAWCRGDIS